MVVRGDDGVNPTMVGGRSCGGGRRRRHTGRGEAVVEAEELTDEGGEGDGEEVAGVVGGVGAEEGLDGSTGGGYLRRGGGGEDEGSEGPGLGEGVEGVGVRVMHGGGDSEAEVAKFQTGESVANGAPFMMRSVVRGRCHVVPAEESTPSGDRGL